MKFPTWYKRLSVTERGAILGGVFVLIAALIAIIPKIIYNTDTDLKLVDARIVETEEFPELEFKLRNVGEEIAFIKEARIQVHNVYELILMIHPNARPVSWTYQVELPPKDAPYSKILPLSQEIAPNKTDRFTFSLGYSKGSIDPYIFDVTVDLVYNESNQRLQTNHLIFLMPGNWEIMACVGWRGEEVEKAIKHNLELLRQVKDLNGHKSDSVLNILEELEKLEMSQKK